MSNILQKNTEPSIIANIAANLNTFISKVLLEIDITPKFIPLKLNSTQIPLLLSNWPSHKKPLCLLTDLSITESKKLIASTRAWSNFFNPNSTYHLITDELSEQERQGIISTSLSQTLHQLLHNPNKPNHHYIIPLNIIPFNIPDPKKYHQSTLNLAAGDQVKNLSHLTELLVNLGYTRISQQSKPGTIQIKGDQITVNHPALSGHYTITFFGRIIEQITHFTNRRSQIVKNLNIPPIKFPDELVLWEKAFGNHQIIQPGWVDEDNFTFPIIYDSLEPQISFPLESTALTNKDLIKKHWHIFSANTDRIKNYCQSRQLVFTIHTSPLNKISFALTDDHQIYTTEKTIYSNDSELKPISQEQGLQLIGQLQIGKPAVHRDHGIGIYDGLQQKTINNQTRDYLVIRYANDDTLSIPIEFAHKVTAYIGSGHPKIHRLSNPTSWQKSRQQASEDAATFAKEILLTASTRQSRSRKSYDIDSSIEDRLNQSFPYQLTPDQQTAWAAVKQDLQNDHPTDRLIVGDVGFGKTEIALRAAFHVAQSGKQTALIAPTTLLVQQHFDTFTSRFPDQANQIGLLSRFISAKQQKDTREIIASGEAKIVIGTHALLSNKTNWRNLGLIIIDEEQRFGVKQKEILKKVRNTADVISLSATPIPRTLSMSLTGLRDLSVISTPPTGRQAIKTHVAPESDSIITKAINQELQRQGQVYVVAHHIRKLPAIQKKINQLLPNATTAIAHGQMDDNKLAAVMHQFDSGEIEILISSTIVENGLDLPNANTLITFQTTHFGLSDLYQLRGRVGRRQKQGHAFFLYDPTKPLTNIQRQRLTAITEASRLGSGWDLAQRDLEIRGAGNLLGSEQSGSVNSIGLQLYLDLVQEAVEKSEKRQLHQKDVDITLPVTSLIPDHYINSSNDRAKAYQQLTRAKNTQELQTQSTHFEQTYGPLPEETKNLVAILDLQHTAADNHIASISSQKITPSDMPAYHKLTIHTKNALDILNKLSSLGNWQAQENSITLNIRNIDLNLIHKLTSLLSNI